MFSIFGSAHIKKSIDAVSQIAQENSESIASTFVAGKAKLILKSDKKKTNASIDEDKLSYRGLASLVMSNVIFNELASGQHHVYRGVLNANGKSMRFLWGRICELLVQEELSSQHEIEQETRDLDEAIRKCG
jgi:hypothetical protein